jgi:hypothetical protein
MSMSEQAPRQHGRKNVFRLVAATSTAAILLGSSFYAAQAGAGGPGLYADDGDTDTAKIVGVTVGAGAAVWLIAAAVDRNKDKDSTSEDKAKSAKAGKVKQVRALPTLKQLGAGDTTVVEVQARYAGSNTWETVTDRASIKLVSGGLTQVDGAKNAFAVPYGSAVKAGPASVQVSFGGQQETAQFLIN